MESPQIREIRSAALPPIEPPSAAGEAPSESRGRDVLKMLLATGIGAGVALLGIRFLDSGTGLAAGSGPLEWLVVVALSIAAIFLVLLVHEAGHALAARSAGFTLIALVVGPLALVRRGGRLRLSLNRSLAFYGGVMLSIPLRWPGRERFRAGMLRMVAGGPLASLLVGLAALLGSLAVAVPPLLVIPVWLLGIASLGIALVTSLPLSQPGGLLNDGAQFLRLFARGPAGEAWLAMCALVVASLAARPREWDPGLVAWATAIPADGEVVSRTQRLAHHHALDMRDAAAARERLQAAVAQMDRLLPAERDATALDAAIFEALWRGDAEAARRWRDAAAAPGKHDPFAAAVAEAALARAAGDEQRVAAALDRARTLPQGAFGAPAALRYAPVLERLRTAPP